MNIGVNEPLLPSVIGEGNVFRSVSANDAIGQSQVLWGYLPQALVSSCTKHSGTPRPRICPNLFNSDLTVQASLPIHIAHYGAQTVGGRLAFDRNAFLLLFYVYSTSLRPGSMIDTSILGKRRLKSVYFLNTLFTVSATPPWCKPFSRCQKKTCSLLSKYVHYNNCYPGRGNGNGENYTHWTGDRKIHY